MRALSTIAISLLATAGWSGFALADDFGSSTFSAGSVRVPGSAFGVIETGNDQDWFAVQLQGGTAYTIDLEGRPTGRGSLSDPYLYVFDGNGTEIERNDDGGQGFNSRLAFTPRSSGTYYLGAGSWSSSTGTYTLTIAGSGGGGRDDYPASTGTSGTVYPGGSTTGTIENGNDEDWFAVQLQGGATYTIDLEGEPTGRGTLSDPYLRLYNGFGSQVMTNDDGGTGFNSRITYTAPSAGIYYVGAGSFGASTGSYTLSVTGGGSGGFDDYAADQSTRGRVAAGGSANGTIENGSDEDWFAVQFQSGASYVIDVEGQATGRGTLSDPLAVLYDSGGREINRNDDGGQGLNSRLSGSVPAGGTYYLGVRSFGSATGSYTVTVAGSGGFDDYPDNASTRGAVNPGGAATGTIESGDDVDWFAAQLQAGTQYTVDVEGQPTGRGTLSDPYLIVFDTNGIELESNDDGGQGLNSRLDFVPRTTGRHYLAVRSYGQATGSYTLSLSAGSVPDDYADNTGTQGRIAVGESVTGDIETGEDVDWFRTDLTAGGTYIIDAEGQPTGQGTLSDTYIILFDGNGTEIDRNDDGGQGFNSRLEVAASASGPHYIGVRSFGTNTGSYTLSLSSPDDYPADATTTGRVGPGGLTGGTIEAAGDVDWFAIQMQTGTSYVIDLEGSPTNAGSLSDPLLYLFDPNGLEVDRNDDGGQRFNARLTVVPATPGRYYIGASAYADATGSYRLSVSTGAAADDYPGDSSTTGRVDGGSSTTGILESGSDEDWFAIHMQAGSTYTVDLEGQPTGAGTLSDPLLRLYDTTGRELASNDDGGTGFNSRLEHTADSSGLFYLGASSFGDSAGSYRLSVDVTGSGSK